MKRKRKLIPLTEEQARNWAEKRLDADEYIEIFGEPEEQHKNEVPFIQERVFVFEEELYEKKKKTDTARVAKAVR